MQLSPIFPVPWIRPWLFIAACLLIPAFIVQAGQRPTGNDRTITLNEDSTYQFNVADYGFSDGGDVPPDAFTRIKLTTLPVAGTLTLDGHAVAQNDFISMRPVPGIVWTPRQSPRTWQEMVVSSNGSTMAALGFESFGAYIHVSTDGGVSWAARAGLLDWSSIACSVDGGKMIASQFYGNLYTSTDFGLNWTARGASRAWTKVGSSADGTKLYAVADGLYHSPDSGLTWARLTGAPNGRSFTVSPDGTRLSMVDFESRVYTSLDSGVTWLAAGGLPGITLSLAASADGTRLVACGYQSAGGYTGYLSTSINSGQIWTVRESSTHWNAVTVSAEGSILAAAAGEGQIHVSTDSGNTWVPRAGIQPWHYVVCSADGSRMLAGGESTALFTSDPTLPAFTYRPPPDQNGSPYASFTFHAEDSGEAPDNLALSPNTITLNVADVNDAPVVTRPIADSFAPVGSSWLLVLPPDHFGDVDADSTLTYSATAAAGGPLPSWLSFDPVTRTFSGTPSELERGYLDVRITATDDGVPPLSQSIDFRLTSGSDAPAGADISRETEEDVPYVFTAEDFGFTDPGDDPPDLFAGVTITTLPAAGELSVEGVPLAAGEFVSASPEARLRWTRRGAERNFVSLTSSADGLKLAAADNSALYLSSDAGITWTTTRSGLNWECIASSADGMKLVAGVYGGQLYTSTDAGVTWYPRDSDRAWQAVASSGDGTKLVAGSNEGHLYTSVDSGSTWIPRGIITNWASVASSYDGSNLVAAARSGQLYTSTDSGISWTPRDQNRYWYAVASSADGSRLAAVDGTAIFHSSNAGISWEAVQAGSAWRDIASSGDGSKLVAVAYNGLIYTSRDGGQRWTAREQRRFWSCVASSSDGDKLAAAGQNVSVYTSMATVPGLRFTPTLNASGTPYTSFTFQVEDQGTGGPTMDPDANTFLFSVRAVNDPPTVAIPIPDRPAVERQPFSYQISIGSFSDVDPDTVITFTALLADGSPLPAWLAFNPDTRIFYGTPGSPDVGSTAVRVTATDNGAPPLGTSDIFEINVANVDDPPSGRDGMASMGQGGGYLFSSADFPLSDPDDLPPNLLSRVKITSLPAVGTLTVNGAPASAGTMVRMVESAPGSEWNARERNRNWASIASSADGTKLVAVAGGPSGTERIYTSIDSGATWTARESNRNWIAVASSADGVKLIAAVGSGGALYTSTNSGITWTPRATSGPWNSVASSADGTKLVAGQLGGRIYTSVDSGLTWTARENNRSWQAVASSSDGTRLAAAESFGRIFLSKDSGVSWTLSTQELWLWRSITSSADGTRLAAVVQDGQIYTSADSGASWTARESVRSWSSIASSADGTLLAAVAQNGRILISADSGITWKARETSRSWRCVASSADGSKLAAAVSGGQIFTSEVQPAESLVFKPEPEGNGIPYTSFRFQVEDDAAPPAANLDPTSHLFSLTVSGPALFQGWALQHSLSPDPNLAGPVNVLRYSFGMDSSNANPVLTLEDGVVSRRGIPALVPPGDTNQGYSAMFGRRKGSGLTSVIQFSENLTFWEDGLPPPVILADDGVIEVCLVPFPATLSNGQIPKFFRLAVSMP